MKLIIDIDEDVYKLFTGNGQGMKVVKFNLENALKNGTPLEEEFEQIKTEIRNKKDGYGKYPVCDNCIKIIDKHIGRE